MVRDSAARALVTVTLLAACGSGDQGSPCLQTEPWCDAGDLVACVDGAVRREGCRPGTECRVDRCVQTEVVFPFDAAPHDLRSEWWYYTGHLSGGGRDWGFQLTIFQYAMSAIAVYMCHVAVIDHAAGVHVHGDWMEGEAVAWSLEPIDLEIASCNFELGGDGRDRVRGVIEEGEEADGHPGRWELELELEPDKPVALHGGDGEIPMSDAGGLSWYYSYTRLSARGTLETPDGELAVQGQAWMDHQWGDFDVSEFQGWDWWSMQLDDGSEVMLFQFRGWGGGLASQAGTLVSPEGETTALEALDAFEIESLRTWESPHTRGVYPLDWEVVIPVAGLALSIRAGIDDQEMHNPAQNYWEGPVSIVGSRDGDALSGVGFVELTGYAADALDP